jgi:hypothetical protein
MRGAVDGLLLRGACDNGMAFDNGNAIYAGMNFYEHYTRGLKSIERPSI